MEIFLVRHGQSEANLTKTVQGTMNSPLTEQGREQAKKLREVLPRSIDHVYTSTLDRAYETGILALGRLVEDVEITQRKELEEICFGDLQGRPYHDTGYEYEVITQHVRFEKDVLRGKNNSETIQDFFERTHGIFDEIVDQMIRNNWNKVVVFTHGGVLRAVLQYHLKLTSERFENCEVAHLKFDKYQNKWELERWKEHII